MGFLFLFSRSFEPIVCFFNVFPRERESEPCTRASLILRDNRITSEDVRPAIKSGITRIQQELKTRNHQKDPREFSLSFSVFSSHFICDNKQDLYMPYVQLSHSFFIVFSSSFLQFCFLIHYS